ncbi:hypothetical protein Q8F55_007277 [Vanrija albida]|uniref:Carboxylesterase type B domain-containing protein n=1 Tax=Vanrija albida TaxID=181172 RepID=A0ABR3PZH1_9TREE
MLLRTIVLLLTAGSALGAVAPRGKPTSTAPAPGQVTATIKHKGSKIPVIGKELNGAELFGGIPFAKPPVGDLRWEHPQPAEYGSTIDALQIGDICPQDLSRSAIRYNVSEDCLTLNIQRPVGTSAKDKLPVMFWIYGGSFIAGANARYTSPYLVNYGKATGRPFILVTINYRVGWLGWPYGNDFAKHKAGNLGLRDQILALEWTRDHIAAFGGDPKKVTAFGESAGSISIAILLLNKKQKLFRGAIMQSGSAATTGVFPVGEAWQETYDALAKSLGCEPAATRWDCMKAVPSGQLLNASIALKFTPRWLAQSYSAPSIDGDLIPTHPYDIIKSGKFAKMPMIMGTTGDEGTAFVPLPITPPNEAANVQFIKTLGPTPLADQFSDKIFKAYPNDPAMGSPFNTGNQTFGLPPSRKQLTAIMGDMAFVSKRRFFQRAANKQGNSKVWSYEFKSLNPGSSPANGFVHAADVFYTFGQVNTTANYTTAQVEVSEALMNYWINFAYYLDPNGKSGGGGKGGEGGKGGKGGKGGDGGEDGKDGKDGKDGEDGKSGKTKRFNVFPPPPGVVTPNTKAEYPYWPAHNYPKNKNQLLFSPGNIGVVQDDYREKQMEVFLEPDMIRPLGQRGI